MNSRLTVMALVTFVLPLVLVLSVGSTCLACPGDSAAGQAKTSCGVASDRPARITYFQDTRPLDRGNLIVRLKPCPKSGLTNVSLSVVATDGRPDPGATFTAYLGGQRLALVPGWHPGIFKGEAKVCAGTHELRVQVHRGPVTSDLSFSFLTPAKAISATCSACPPAMPATPAASMYMPAGTTYMPAFATPVPVVGTPVPAVSVPLPTVSAPVPSFGPTLACPPPGCPGRCAPG